MANIWDPVSMAGTTPPASPNPIGVGNPWYRPGGNYGQTQDWYNTPIGGSIREQDQPLAFASWLTRQGIGNTDNTFNRWAYSQTPRFQQAYDMATMDNPTMNIDQFIKTMPTYDQLRSEFQSLSPNARGAQHALYSPNARWLPR